MHAESDAPIHDRAGAGNILDRIPILSDLSETEREALGALLRRRQFGEGEAVYEQGQPGDSVFVIEAGVVSVRRAGTSGIEEEIGRLGPGDVVGSNAVLTGRRAMRRCAHWSGPPCMKFDWRVSHRF